MKSTPPKTINQELKEKIDMILKVYGGWVHLGNISQSKQVALEQLLSLIDEEKVVTGETSDGYHTFNELYEFRKVYNAVLFNEWSAQGKYNIHKSWKHSDGEKCFGGGWFIVSATLPSGQISNHYEAKDWDLFKCEERELADKWDGHTAQDVVKRLLALVTNLEEKCKGCGGTDRCDCGATVNEPHSGFDAVS